VALNNYRLSYRPLVAGTMISSSEIKRSGTIACFATSNGIDIWALTAAHVISASRALTLDIGQPDYFAVVDQVNDTGTPIRYTPGTMDVAAFQVKSAIPVTKSVLELGEWCGVVAPTKGMTVIKSGCTTGVTRGRIGDVRQQDFDVHIEPGMPDGYVSFGPGDSGAAWFIAGTNILVGIHLERVVQRGIGVATRMDLALAEMRLTLL
jgi:hypothetical protein